MYEVFIKYEVFIGKMITDLNNLEQIIFIIEQSAFFLHIFSIISQF